MKPLFGKLLPTELWEWVLLLSMWAFIIFLFLMAVAYSCFAARRKMSEYTWVHLDFAEIERETQKAFLVRLVNGKTVWIPMSVIADYEDYKEGNKNGTISVQEWFATKEKLQP